MTNSQSEIRKAQTEGATAARAGRPQTDNPHNPKKPGDAYNVGLALAWSHGFEEVANPGAARD